MRTDDGVPSSHEHVQRKASLPVDRSALSKQQLRRVQSVGEGAPVQRRDLPLARHQSVSAMSAGKSTRPKRKVAFKTTFTLDIVPPPKVESYDELVFNVAGLFHTTSFLHDQDDWGEDPTGSVSSDEEYYEPEPLERSVPLMIAEFLWRSAVFLGYPQGDTPWLPGFREDKKFSGNDVKRWRRLAHFDWELEEREFLKHHAHKRTRSQSAESNGHTSVMSTLGMSFHMQSADLVSSGQGSNGAERTSTRGTVSGLIRKYRQSHSREQYSIKEEEQETAVNSASKDKERKHEPVSWLNPPPITSARKLRLLVDIINSCIYCGQFQFRKRDIVRLCNVKI